MVEKSAPAQDAGRRSLDHYKKRLPSWRFNAREILLPVVRYETPRIAYLQKRLRSPALDLYFAMTANLGTHTFYMTILPILFWCGYHQLARHMVSLLTGGVFLTGVFKDLVCLPRPLSPPLQRISKSKSAPLEYGFPSTHAANAASAVIYGVYLLRQYPHDGWTPIAAEGLLYFFFLTIVAGRVYCGMHGFLDCVFGMALGSILAAAQIMYGHYFDTWIINGGAQNVLLGLLVGLILVRIHPEPADDCPCFDDSVAFMGSIIGVNIGSWHFQTTGFAVDSPIPSTAPYSIEKLGWFVATARILLGVMVVFLWRGTMKPTLFKVLPPVFRIIERLGLSLPRKFFLKASEYRSVPPLKKDDSVIPPASDIPGMLDSLRHPKRRTVSIGPQSEADAYEAMALRERRRREYSDASTENIVSPPALKPSFQRTDTMSVANEGLHDSAKKDVDAILDASTPAVDSKTVPFPDLPDTHAEDDHDQDDQALFATLQAPRVRYDVEVVTKLIVYTGIGVLASEGGPIIFELCGLGMGVRPTWI